MATVRRRARRGRAPQVFLELAALETDECVEWPYYRLPSGYGQLLWEGRPTRTHRLALSLRIPCPDPELDAAHGPCHNRACLNYRHLSWKTRKDNLFDRHRDGVRVGRAPAQRMTDTGGPPSSRLLDTA